MKPLTSDMQLRQIEIQGYKSIENCKLELGALNILIGANGAGKSNLLSVFNLIKNIMDGNLLDYILFNGGAKSVLYYGGNTSDRFTITLLFKEFMYEASIVPTVDDRSAIEEKYSAEDYRNAKLDIERTEYPSPRIIRKGYESFAKPMYEESFWLNPANHDPVEKKYLIKTKNVVQSIIKTLRQYRTYHFNDTSDTALLKKYNQINDNIYLRQDGRNLAAFLYLLKEVYPKSYSQIVDTVQAVAPFFDDFFLRPEPKNNEIIMLEWLANGYDQPFKAFQLSDGTLRFIGLATLLLQPEELMPQTIVIDEPELGLNPFAISILGELIKSVATERQLIISTQSVELLNEFDLEDIVVIDYVDGKSVIERKKQQEFETWLEDYTIGELWLKNFLGGRPA